MAVEKPDEVLAWLVTEGDVLPSGARVLSVRREVLHRTVRISTTTQPVGVELPQDHPVAVARRVL